MLRITSLLIFLSFCLTAFPQKLTTDQTERLFHYSKVYGTVRYFHPYMAYRSINWDEAWAAQAPAVAAAKTDEEYAGILEKLLTVLDDPATKVIHTTEQAAPPSENPQPFHLQWLEDSTLVIKAKSGYQLPDLAIHDQHLTDLKADILKAKAVIFDWQFEEAFDPGWAYIDVIFGWYGWENALCTGAFRAAAQVKSYHRGFQPEQGTTSGGYYSGFTVQLGKVYNGERTEDIPVVFIVNQHAVNQLPGIAYALQEQGHGLIINVEQTVAQEAGEIYDLTYSDNLSVQVRASEAASSTPGISTKDLIGAAKSSDYGTVLKKWTPKPTIVSAGTTSEGPALFSGIPHLPVFTEEAYPGLGDRLLAAARIYTIIDLFFPYKDLMDHDWASKTKTFLPSFVAAENALEYQQAVFGLYHYIQDSHGNARGANANLLTKELFGTNPPPFYTSWIQGAVAIEQVLQDSLGNTEVGDVILAKDGVPIEDILQEIRQYSAFSTEQAFYRRATQRALLTPKQQLTTYTIKHQDGTVEDITYFTTREHYDNYQSPRRDTMRWLSDKIAYADLNTLATSQVDDFFATYGNAEALVFDMRGYPNGTAWAIAPRLSQVVSPKLAIFNCPLVFGPNLTTGDMAWSSADYQFMQSVPYRDEPKYEGKIVVLINEDAISQAEHTCLFLEQVADVTFIGSPTMGANGDVTNFIIPGGLRLTFSGQGVRHADGRQLQRLGIQPDIPCQPSIAGIREGKDEVLERAITFLQENK